MAANSPIELARKLEKKITVRGRCNENSFTLEEIQDLPVAANDWRPYFMTLGTITDRTKAVVFDLGDTLIEYEGLPLSWEAHYADALSALAKDLSISSTPEALACAYSVLRRYNTRLHPRTEEVCFKVILDRIVECFEAPEISDEEELSCARSFFGVFRRRLRCFPDSHPTLIRLRNEGVKIGLFSDVPYGMPTQLVLEDLKDAGLEESFDVIMTSRDVGFRKRAPETLRQISEQLDCVAENIIYVGNEKKDVDVAHAFGCQSTLLDRMGLQPAWCQGRTIRTLAELLAS